MSADPRADRMVPGEVFVADGDLELAPGRERRTLRIDHRGDRPIQIGSHTHVFEVNRALAFDRARAYGFRLDLPAGTALRLEPGEAREVTLVAFAGDRRAYGMSALTSGDLHAKRDAAFAAARARGFLVEDDA
jgi:urease beta subunit